MLPCVIPGAEKAPPWWIDTVRVDSPHQDNLLSPSALRRNHPIQPPDDVTIHSGGHRDVTQTHRRRTVSVRHLRIVQVQTPRGGYIERRPYERTRKHETRAASPRKFQTGRN